MNKFLGIDVSKDELVIYNPIDNKTTTISNSKTSIIKFIKKIDKFNLHNMILEATGSYDYLACWTFQEKGYNIHKINPSFIKNFIKSKGNIAKNR